MKRVRLDPLDVLERIRWQILEANGAGEQLWERLSHLGEALDLVPLLETAIEDAIRVTAHDIRVWGVPGGGGDAEVA